MLRNTMSALFFASVLSFGFASCGDAADSAKEGVETISEEAKKKAEQVEEKIDKSMEALDEKADDLEKALEDL